MLIGKYTTLDEAKRAVSNAVYKAALIFEALENEGLIHGNGHHIAQDIAEHAVAVVEERWSDKAVAAEEVGAS